MSSNTPSKNITPLGAITTFFGITEVALTIGATQTKDGIQIALVSFVIFFSTVTLIGFLFIIWKRPHHFYSAEDISKLDANQIDLLLNRLSATTVDKVKN